MMSHLQKFRQNNHRNLLLKSHNHKKRILMMFPHHQKRVFNLLSLKLRNQYQLSLKRRVMNSPLQRSLLLENLSQQNQTLLLLSLRPLKNKLPSPLKMTLKNQTMFHHQKLLRSHNKNQPQLHRSQLLFHKRVLNKKLLQSLKRIQMRSLNLKSLFRNKPQNNK